MHILSKDGAVVATVVLTVVEVVVSAAGGIGWEDVGFLATGFLNFDMSNFLIFCFFSFFVVGIGASSLWLSTYVELGLGSIKSVALDLCGVEF